jgi:hypothetical protein
MRDDRRLNALARGRLRAQRGGQRRLPGDDGGRRGRPAVPQVSTAEPPAVQTLVAILGPVLGCAEFAEPPAPATLLWLPSQC